jgi:3-phosphoshikimate 1-carboxyvinyltransferase
MGFFEEVLPQLGVRISTRDGHLPATISGRLVPRNIRVDGSVSSQFITGLLMAYAGARAGDVSVTVDNAVSTPYIELTLEIMRAAGLNAPVLRDDNSYYFEAAKAGPDPDKVIDFHVEGDWSNAAFWLVAGAIAGPVTVLGLDVFSAQADKAILAAMMACGAAISVESNRISVSPAPLKAFHFNASNSPDLFPPLAALACYASGTSVIEGVGRLKHKESDRARTICGELGRLGADISLQDDYMVIRGKRALHGAVTSSHNDHRIAMMCAIAALGAEGPVRIEDAGAVEKSYPRFFEDLARFGSSDRAG